MPESSISVTPGSGEKVATHKFTEAGEEKHIQRTNLNDASGAPLLGQKTSALSVPVVLSIENLLALLKTDPSTGFVEIPSSSPLTTASRGIVITAAGNLVVKQVDGTDNSNSPIAVTPGMQFPWQVVQKLAGNTAGVLGLK